MKQHLSDNIFDLWLGATQTPSDESGSWFLETYGREYSLVSVLEQLNEIEIESNLSVVDKQFDFVFSLTDAAILWLFPRILRCLVLNEYETIRSPVFGAIMEKIEKNRLIFDQASKEYKSYGLAAVNYLRAEDILGEQALIMYDKQLQALGVELSSG